MKALFKGAFFILGVIKIKVSDKIKEMELMEFKKLQDHFVYEIELEVKHLAEPVKISFNTVQDEELCLAEVLFDTDLVGPYKGILMGYQKLISGKPVEVLDRLTPKELDYFLRDDTKIPAIEYYSKELYEILSIGELITKKLGMGQKEVAMLYDLNQNGPFLDLSFSEQIEFFEEFCSSFIYSSKETPNLFFDVEDIDDEKISLIGRGSVTATRLKALEKQFNIEFDTNLIFEIIN